MMMLCCPVLVQSSHIQTVLSQLAETHHTERLLPTEKEKDCILSFTALFIATENYKWYIPVNEK
jgi:hypothetical protein